MHIENAIITSATIDMEQGFLNSWLHLNYGGSGQGFGGYALYLPNSYAHHELKSVAGHWISRCMEIAGVKSWAEMEGKTVRVKKETPRGRVVAVGHIINDDWFEPGKEFNQGEDE